jgi:hypothetical protein
LRIDNVDRSLEGKPTVSRYRGSSLTQNWS